MWDIRIFWNELTDFFFYFQLSLFLNIFWKYEPLVPYLYILFFADKSMM